MYYKILEEIRDLKTIIKGRVADRWLTITDVSNYTSLSDSTIRRAVRKETLKCSKNTGKLLSAGTDCRAVLSGNGKINQGIKL